jgi:hypothetical protein
MRRGVLAEDQDTLCAVQAVETNSDNIMSDV